jgi:hypothetical protein
MAKQILFLAVLGVITACKPVTAGPYGSSAQHFENYYGECSREGYEAGSSEHNACQLRKRVDEHAAAHGSDGSNQGDYGFVGSIPTP